MEIIWCMKFLNIAGTSVGIVIGKTFKCARHIRTTWRNRLSPEVLRRLVFIYWNINTLRKLDKQRYQQTYTTV